jgi:hypothetical protein
VRCIPRIDAEARQDTGATARSEVPAAHPVTHLNFVERVQQRA